MPVFLAAVGFGLATDYGVFLLGRIKEAHDGGLNNREAVAQGLERTGRIVTAAALLFAVVALLSVGRAVAEAPPQTAIINEKIRKAWTDNKLVPAKQASDSESPIDAARREKIEQLKKAVADGTYNVSAEEVARKLIEHMLEPKE